jgi:hypothetical protein
MKSARSGDWHIRPPKIDRPKVDPKEMIFGSDACRSSHDRRTFQNNPRQDGSSFVTGEQGHMSSTRSTPLHSRATSSGKSLSARPISTTCFVATTPTSVVGGRQPHGHHQLLREADRRTRQDAGRHARDSFGMSGVTIGHGAFVGSVPAKVLHWRMEPRQIDVMNHIGW